MAGEDELLGFSQSDTRILNSVMHGVTYGSFLRWNLNKLYGETIVCDAVISVEVQVQMVPHARAVASTHGEVVILTHPRVLDLVLLNFHHDHHAFISRDVPGAVQVVCVLQDSEALGQVGRCELNPSVRTAINRRFAIIISIWIPIPIAVALVTARQGCFKNVADTWICVFQRSS